MNAKTVILTIAIAVPLALAGRWARQGLREEQTRDAVQMVAQAVHPLYLAKKNPTREEINRAVYKLGTAGVTNLQVGPDGRPADPYRTPLLIHHEVKGKQAITTVTSAGADREFSTPDDVTWVEKTDLPGPPEAPKTP